MRHTRTLTICLMAVAALPAACAQDSVSPLPGDKTGSLNVVQAGAQDYALFRSIVDQGNIPDPSTLDPVGFFAEHAMDLPPADCGQDICVHPMLAVAPRFNKTDWTMAFVAMNTPIDPSTLERPPLHLVLVIERQDNFELGGWLTTEVLKESVAPLVQNLRPEDRISVVFMGVEPRTTLFASVADPAEVNAAIDKGMYLPPGNDIFGGLVEAHRALETASGLDAKRILLITSGSTSGITDPAHIVDLAAGITQEGVALGVLGFGENYSADIPTALGSLGAGTYSYAPNQASFIEALKLEGETALFPLATNFKLTVKPSPGYRVGRIYGVKRAALEGSDATLKMPALFIGQREGSADVGGGRRGGGGGLFVELRVDPEEAKGIDAGAPAFQMSASWLGSDGTPASTSRVMTNPLRPGEIPSAMWPELSDPERGKPFMMLNMYLALRAAVSFYASGDCSRALGVIDMMGTSVDGWQGKYNDPDIAADNTVMLKLRGNLQRWCASATPVKPVTWTEGSCMVL